MTATRVRIVIFAAAILAVCPVALAQEKPSTQWWTDARLGMKITWGPASFMPEGRGPWTIDAEGWQAYLDAVDEFNPTRYNFEHPAQAARAMQAEYVILPAKAHTGFCMWDTETTDFKITNTAWGKDFLKLQLEAMRRADRKVGIYFSMWDWSRPEFAGVPPERPGIAMRRAGRTGEEGNDRWKEYQQLYLAQLEELLTQYGPLDIIWLDGLDKSRPQKWASDKIYRLIRKHQPDALINERWGDPSRADFLTPEGGIPEKAPDMPWEHIVAQNTRWYFHWQRGLGMSHPEVVREMVETVAKNGNFVLNMPPASNGMLHPSFSQTAGYVGNWMKINGEAIRGCGDSPLWHTPWGSATAKEGHIYLHVYPDRQDAADPLLIRGAGGRIRTARLFGGMKHQPEAEPIDLKVTVDGEDALVHLPDGYAIQEAASVVDLAIDWADWQPKPNYITDWTVSQCLPGRGGRTFLRKLGPEKVILPEGIEFDDKTYRWNRAKAKEGYLDLAELAEGYDGDGAAFAAVDIIADSETPAELILQIHGNAEVYLNTQKVDSTGWAGMHSRVCRRIALDLLPGRNALVIKTAGRGDEWGFSAAIGAPGLKFEPTRSLAIISNDPETWLNADIVIEGETVEKLVHADVLSCRRSSNNNVVRLHPAEPFDDRGLYTSFTVPRDLQNAWLLGRYGKKGPTRMKVAIEGRETLEIDMPRSVNYRLYQTDMVRLGDIKAGTYRLHAFATMRGAFHFDGFVITEGERLGNMIRK